MKHTLLAALVGCLLASQPGIAAPASPPTAEIKAQVIAAHDAALAAAESLNIDELLRGVADNNEGALIMNGRLVLTRADVAATTRANFRGITRLKYEIGPRHVTVLGPDAALLVTTGSVLFETEQGGSVRRNFAHTFVYTRDHGTWRVLHSHQSNPLEDTAR